MGYTDEEFRQLPDEAILAQAFEGEFANTINEFELARGGQVRPEGFAQWVGMGQYLGQPHRFEIFICEDE